MIELIIAIALLLLAIYLDVGIPFKKKSASLQSREILPNGINVLLTGRAGNGKTTIAKTAIMNARRQYYFKIMFTTGTGITRNDIINAVAEDVPVIIFIDEIHTLPKKLTPPLYTIMEERILSVGNSVFDASHVFIWGATTDTGKLSDAIRSRFQLELFIPSLTEEQLAMIDSGNIVNIDKYISLLTALLTTKPQDVIIPQSTKLQIIKNLGLSTPREVKAVITVLKAIATLKQKDVIDDECVEFLYDIYGFRDGLTYKEREVINALKLSPDNRMTKNRIASISGIDIDELDKKLIPTLIKKNKIKITSKGVELINE